MKTVRAFDHAREITELLPKGILLTTAAGGRVNSMTIGWGMLGTYWGNRPYFTAVVRESRYSRELLDENPEFTVNVPYGEYDRNIIKVCGSESGRDGDKIKKLGLTLVQSSKVNVPGILELPLTLECRVNCRQKLDVSLLPPEIRAQFYPDPADPHIAFYGEIVNCCIAE